VHRTPQKDGPGTDRIGDEHIREQLPVKRVVLHDVSQQEPVSEPTGCQRSLELDVEDILIVTGLDEPTRITEAEECDPQALVPLFYHY
jgi:hypothetical protein